MRSDIDNLFDLCHTCDTYRLLLYITVHSSTAICKYSTTNQMTEYLLCTIMSINSTTVDTHFTRLVTTVNLASQVLQLSSQGTETEA